MSYQSCVQFSSSPSNIIKGINDVIEIINEDEKLNNSFSDLETPEEIYTETDYDNILRNKFINLIKEGIHIYNEIIPYCYFIKKLHSIGNDIINKKTKDTILLRVYEIGNDNFQEFWVHPIYLSLQSFQFFKLFDEVNCNSEDNIIEFEVPSLNTFSIILYWLYTGNKDKILEIGKLNENIYEDIINNIQYLEINSLDF